MPLPKGVSFIFPIPDDYPIKESVLPLELPNGRSPPLARMYVFLGNDYRAPAIPPLAKCPSSEGVGSSVDEVDSVVAELKRGITVNFVPTNNVPATPTTVTLDVTTPQDLRVEIGSPLRIFYKEEDKMRIHSEEAADADDYGANGTSNGVEGPSHAEVPSRDYFYNYFHLGFDELFDGTTHRCKKIVLHTNMPGHYDFQRYKRCPYKLRVRPKVNRKVNRSSQAAQLPIESSDEENHISVKTRIQDIRDLIGDPPDDPLIFNRGSRGQNPFGPTELYGYDGAVFEVMKNGYVTTVTLF